MSNPEIVEQVRAHLHKKHFGHGGVDSILQRDNRSMIRIGGWKSWNQYIRLLNLLFKN